MREFWFFRGALSGVILVIAGLFYPYEFTKVSLLVLGSLLFLGCYLLLRKNRAGVYLWLISLGCASIFLLAEGFTEKNIAKIIAGIIFALLSLLMYFNRSALMVLILPPESEISVKRGNGYLALGLTILIILLSIFWNTTVMKFFKKDINKEQQIEKLSLYTEKETVTVEEIDEGKLRGIIISLSQKYEIGIDSIERKDIFLEVLGIAKNMGNFFDFVNEFQDYKVEVKPQMIRKIEDNKIKFVIKCNFATSPAPK